MRKIFLILCTLVSIGIYAQNVEFEQENFDSKEQYEKAIMYLIEGDYYYGDDLEWYNLALENYLKAYEFNPDNAELNFKIGNCEYITLHAFEALDYYKKAYALDSNVSEEIHYRLGQGYQYRLQFNKALEHYRKFSETYNGEDKEAWLAKTERRIKECKDSKDLVTIHTGALVKNIRRINSKYMDHSPVISADEKTIFFTSRRPLEGEDREVHKKDGKKKKEKGNNDYKDGYHGYGRAFEDVYYAKKNEQGVFTEAVNMGDIVNSKNHDATIGLSFDGKRVYIYDGKRNGGDIMVSRNRNGKWTKPEPLPKPINSKYYEVSISHFPDNKTVYFVSDRPGGYGGMDIWSTTLQKDGSYSDPVPLSDVINTEYNERSVFIHKSGKIMYFSSEGHKNMGGYDIFRTEMDDNGNWTKPVNMGYPINTPGDDVTFVTSPDDKRGYFASLKLNSKGEYDIYTYIFPETDPEKYITLSGTVKDINTLEPLGSRIVISEVGSDEYMEIFSNETTGEYSTRVLKNKDYTINALATNYPKYNGTISVKEEDVVKDIYLGLIFRVLIQDKETKELLNGHVVFTDLETGQTKEIDVTDPSNGKEVFLPKGHTYSVQVTSDGYTMLSESITSTGEGEKIFLLSKNSACEPIVLKNVWFDFDKSTLRPASYVELNQLSDFLKTCGEYNVEISGHTCTMGTYQYNLRLSQRRANSVVKYLVDKGLEEDILSAKGYSYDRPLASNATKIGRQKNRRTEFRLIEKDGPGVINNEGEIGFEASKASSKYSNSEYQRRKGKSNITYTNSASNSSDYLNYDNVENCKAIKIRNVWFDFDKDVLRPASYAELDYLAAFLNNCSDYKVEVSGHTCIMGSHIYNVDLSQRRAQSVVNYLLKKGVKRSQLIVKHFSYDRPLSNNKIKRGREQNRRTEFKLLNKNTNEIIDNQGTEGFDESRASSKSNHSEYEYKTRK